MNRSILILTDFSDAAFRAAEYACYLTPFLQTQYILLYHSYQGYLSNGEFSEVAPGNYEQVYTRSMEELGLLHDRLKSMLDPKITIELIAEDVNLANTINKKCADKLIDIVVAGSPSGKSGIEKWITGSTTTELIKACKVPVFLIPPDAQLGRKIETIAFATDLDDSSIIPLIKIEELLDAFNARLMVINVQEKSNEKFSPGIETAIIELHKIFDKYNPEFHYLNGDDIAQSIFDFSNRHKVSLIIAAPKKHGIFHSMFHKSTTQQLINFPSIPILSLPVLG